MSRKENQNTTTRNATMTRFCPRALPLEILVDRKATSAPSRTDRAVSSRGRASAAMSSAAQTQAR